MAQRIKHFLLNYGPLLTTITIFILVYFGGSRLYPAMQKPQVFFNLFINTASLLIVSIGMTFVIITKGIDLSVAGMIALTSAASAALLANGASPAVVMPLMLVMGMALWPGDRAVIIHFLKVEPFIVTLMGLFFARGMAYIITLAALSIDNPVYRVLALTKVPIPLFEKVYVYIPSLIGPILLIVVFYLSFLHPLWPHGLCHRQQRTIRQVDGAGRRAHKNHRVCLQRLLFRAGRDRMEHFLALGLWADTPPGWSWTRLPQL